ncbi:hypothetical protein SG34_006960 [Thalassomonas viridans]|uniref:Tox-MPTase3 domain-containing protein n=1 Tax=Thalassomonas viridans TaxID=137584 RepID=A0AAE9Z4R9_9GAMM|nr:hypothetical protein [Thalassomonas viridans]WDE06640.1 hypothetical protein SG34_006960 [Thalassomonas viridans]
MLTQDIFSYPRLAFFVRSNLPGRLTNNEKTWSAFRKFGDFSVIESLVAVGWELDSPLLLVESLGKGYNGRFYPSRPSHIYIEQEIAQRFESDYARSDAQRFVESTILHEIVHWGDHKDGHHKPPEAGVDFEIAAYDENVMRYWGNNAHTTYCNPSFLNDAEQAIPSKYRGIRNRNPGNIVRTSDRWKGLAERTEMSEEQKQERRFCVFVEPEWGLRAMFILLRTYQARGCKTLFDYISRWAPASDGNHTYGYANFCANRLKIKKSDVLNIQDKAIQMSMVAAIVAFENGNYVYSNEVMNKAYELSMG